MIFIDTETTGLLRPDAADLNLQPYIIELYAVKLELVDGEFIFIDEYESFFLPPVPLDPVITKITNITPEMLAGQPTFASQYQNLCNFFLGERTMVGHNLSFDAGVLWCELARLECESKFPWPHNWQCTVELSMPVEHHRLKLSALHERATGAPHDGAHRARGDVEATVTVYKWLMEEGYIL